jgi:hypothetical protein
MRNSEESSTRTSRPATPSTAASLTTRATKATKDDGGTLSNPPNAFSPGFLLEASRIEEAPASAPSGLAGGSCWAGPWEVEPVVFRHGACWAVVRRGESMAAGDEPAALTRHRADALLIAATLPALAVPNRLTLGEKARRLGTPVHDGRLCVAHLARPEPRIVEHLHVARALLASPESFALAVEALGREEIPVLGRALARRLVQA